MDQRDSHCPNLPSSEQAAKGTDFAMNAGKEDPVELDSSLGLRNDFGGVAYVGGQPILKYHNSRRRFAYSVIDRKSVV